MRILLFLLGALLCAGAGVIAGARLDLLRAGSQPAPGPVDIGFAQSMGRHHMQAIGMANFMLDGRPTALGGLARSIHQAQLVELGEMRGWLGLWGVPQIVMNTSMDWMLLGRNPPGPELTQYLLDCSRSPTGMRGLATDAEIMRLRTLDSIERDRLFLTLMLAHHEGGVPMARFAATEARLPAVRDLATRVVLDQSEELGRMGLMLSALANVTEYPAPDAPLPPGAALPPMPAPAPSPQ